MEGQLRTLTFAYVFSLLTFCKDIINFNKVNEYRQIEKISAVSCISIIKMVDYASNLEYVVR